ncbi:hypothetical protein P3342_007403 [Pyrenophora teres f. teres]|nr:hypothetical protein P3342_007403 [Pyrenophora teres f. teres]
MQFLQEPQPALRERLRNRPRMLDLRNAGGRGMSGSNGRSGQLVQLGIAEEVCDGQVDASSACLAHQLHRGNRVAAQAEEAVVEADAVCVDGQHARPQLLQRLLVLCRWLSLQALGGCLQLSQLRPENVDPTSRRRLRSIFLDQVTGRVNIGMNTAGTMYCGRNRSSLS